MKIGTNIIGERFVTFTRWEIVRMFFGLPVCCREGAVRDRTLYLFGERQIRLHDQVIDSIINGDPWNDLMIKGGKFSPMQTPVQKKTP